MSLHVFACAACGHKVYPARLWCPACGHAQAEPVAVESGELLAWTSIPDGGRTAPAGDGARAAGRT